MECTVSTALPPGIEVVSPGSVTLPDSIAASLPVVPDPTSAGPQDRPAAGEPWGR